MDATKLLTIQIRVGTNILNFLKNTKAKKGVAAQTASYFDARLNLLRKYFDDFYSRHEQLLEFESSQKDSTYFAEDWFSAVEVAFIDATTELTDDIARLRSTPRDELGRESSSTRAIANSDDSLKVPRLTLPTFSGNRDEWESFKQRFSSLIIQKPTYSAVDKLHFLLSCLQGQAASRLNDIEIVGENFQVAWDQLEKQYGGNRRRLQDLLEKLIQLKPLRTRNAQDLSEMLDVVVVTVRALQKLGCDITAYNHWLVHCILRKLDSHSKETFKFSKESDAEFYQYKDLMSFLENRLDSLDSEKENTPSQSASTPPTKSTGKSKPKHNATAAAHTAEVVKSAATSENKQPSKCLLCQANHSLNSCEKFNSMSAQQRFQFAKKSRLCLNCLGKSHILSECKSSFRCLVCKSKHHTKLHFDAKTSMKEENPPERSTMVNFVTVEQSVLLATAKILVSDSFGKVINARALIDPGAQRSFISERLARGLDLRRELKSVQILGVGGKSTSRAHGEATVIIRSPVCSSFNCSCTALILPELTRLLPSFEILRKEWPHLQGLQLADPEFATPGKIDVILGANLYGSVLQEGLARGPRLAPVAQRTVFGWVLTGAVESKGHGSSTAAYHTVTDDSLPELISKFWEIEEISSPRRYTPEEEYCEKHFASTFSRNPEGRFVVRLPFATKKTFIDARDIAIACLIRSEKRRRNNSDLQDAYLQFMREYEELGHMRPAPPLSEFSDSYFLPHHAVFREDSHKIRVVFHASQRGAAGCSLDDALHPGPKLQTDLTIVISLWRFCQFAMTADIVKMFRQVLMHPDDVNWQRLVWRRTRPLRFETTKPSQ